MAIEDILSALDEQAEEECAQVLAEARDHAAAILAEAERESARIHKHHAEVIEKAARAKANRLVNAARLEAKMHVSEAKGEGVATVFESARSRLGTVRERPDYDALFTALAEEALAGVTGDVVMRVADADVERARSTASALGVTARVEGGLVTAGGVTVEADGGRVIRRNTLEDRIERAVPQLQADVARTLLA